MWGRKAWGWLLTNLLLHLVTTYGIWRLAVGCGAATDMASWAAILFALQPAHGMTVAYVSGRSAGMMTSLLVGSLLAFGTYQVERKKRYLLCSLLLFTLACCAKEMALIFPALLALWVFTRSRAGLAKRSELTSIIPFALVAATLLAAAFSNPRYRGLLEFSLNLRTPLESLVHNAAALPVTLSLLARPWSLAAEHSARLGPYAVSAGAIFILAWIGVACWASRKRHWLMFGMLWPVIALLPAHSFIAKADSVSETSLYLAWVGPSIALGMGSRAWCSTKSCRTVMSGAAVLLVAVCGWRTIVWGDQVLLWREAVTEAPLSARAWNNLGLAYMGRNNSNAAMHAFETALKLDPGNARAIRNLGVLEIVK